MPAYQVGCTRHIVDNCCKTGIVYVGKDRTNYGGGILLFDECNAKDVGKPTILNNYAMQCAGVWMPQDSHLTILESSSFQWIISMMGAGLYILYSSIILSTLSSYRTLKNTAITVTLAMECL